MNDKQLQSFSKTIRKNSLSMIYYAHSGHPGGVLSAADLIAYVFSNRLINYNKTQWLSMNKLVLSKGHACPALYAAAAEAGLVEHSALLNLRKLGSPLQGHPCSCSLPFVETSTGSLGQGFSVAIGMAMGLRHKKQESNVYVLMGDGELQEGEVWEGAMCAGHYKLDNLCGVIDYNKMQSDDLVENIMTVEPLSDKWRSFNWHVIEIDGHDFEEIDKAFCEASKTKGKPTMIIAHTIKGKGVSYMENSPIWHGSVKLSKADLVQALRDLETPEHEIGGYLDGSIWKDN